VRDPRHIDLVTVAEAAELLGCTDRDVYRFIEEEDLTVYRVNTAVHLDRAHIELLVHP